MIRSIDGPIFLTSCFTEAHDCGLAGKCSVREPLRKVHEEIQRLLENITIADMCDEEEAVTAACGSPSSKLDELVSVGPAA